VSAYNTRRLLIGFAGDVPFQRRKMINCNHCYCFCRTLFCDCRTPPQASTFHLFFCTAGPCNHSGHGNHRGAYVDAHRQGEAGMIPKRDSGYRRSALKPATTSCASHARSPNSKSSKKRLLFIASIANLLFLSQFDDAYAAGPIDGEWHGSATVSKNGRCTPGNVELTVLGNQATGQARFGPDARNINGTVRPDGTFGGTIGFQHLTGKFIEDKFEGTLQSFACAWTVILKRGRPAAPRGHPRGGTLSALKSWAAAEGFGSQTDHAKQLLWSVHSAADTGPDGCLPPGF
jgi:hypothetical protein